MMLPSQLHVLRGFTSTLHLVKVHSLPNDDYKLQLN